MIGRWSAMVQAATERADLHVAAEDFDANRDILNLCNGILNMRTAEFGPHRPEAMCSRISPVAWDPDAKAPLMQKHLARVQPLTAHRDYLWRKAGYVSSGLTGEQKFFLEYGSGRNGKGVFWGTIEWVLGDYAQTLPSRTLLAGKGPDAVPNDLARLPGVRLALGSESGQGRRWDTELVKGWTGEDRISARHMRDAWFDFHPQAKIVVMLNHLPDVGSGPAIEGRIETQGWDVTIPEKERDLDLRRNLRAEGPGILRMIVAGFQDYLKVGLCPPEEVVSKSHAHVRGMDVLHTYLDQRLPLPEKPDPAICTETMEIYADYADHCQMAGQKPLAAKLLPEELRQRGYQLGQDSASRRSVVWGVRLPGDLLVVAGKRSEYRHAAVSREK
jgi:putative DNA primase/helicase